VKSTWTQQEPYDIWICDQDRELHIAKHRGTWAGKAYVRFAAHHDGVLVGMARTFAGASRILTNIRKEALTPAERRMERDWQRSCRVED